MKILGLITARGGSKGIPGKNIKPIAGKPLMAYTIEAAQKSAVLDRLILSTDSGEIASVARRHGCEVPFMRPAELARDDTPHLPVVQHAARRLKEDEGYAPDAIMILQPTAPLRQDFHIRESGELFEKSGADSLVSVSEAPIKYNPCWMFFRDELGYLRLSTGQPVKHRIKRRQDFPTSYITNGAIYLFRTNLLFDAEDPNFYGDKVLGYVMDPKFDISIDEPGDWENAERALNAVYGG